MSATAFPLAWPAGFPRFRSREKGKFASTLASALENVQSELRLFGKDSGKPVDSVTISSNYTLGIQSPDDPGVAVYFRWDGLGVCIPVDRYSTLAANLQAISLIIAARRTELRHGTLALVRATFTGFAALPPPDSFDWRTVLEIGVREPKAALAAAELSFRSKAKIAHPDAGGSHDAMAKLSRAIAEARRELTS